MVPGKVRHWRNRPFLAASLLQTHLRCHAVAWVDDRRQQVTIVLDVYQSATECDLKLGILRLLDIGVGHRVALCAAQRQEGRFALLDIALGQDKTFYRRRVFTAGSECRDQSRASPGRAL